MTYPIKTINELVERNTQSGQNYFVVMGSRFVRFETELIAGRYFVVKHRMPLLMHYTITGFTLCRITDKGIIHHVSLIAGFNSKEQALNWLCDKVYDLNSYTFTPKYVIACTIEQFPIILN